MRSVANTARKIADSIGAKVKRSLKNPPKVVLHPSPCIRIKDSKDNVIMEVPEAIHRKETRRLETYLKRGTVPTRFPIAGTDYVWVYQKTVPRGKSETKLDVHYGLQEA